MWGKSVGGFVPSLQPTALAQNQRPNPTFGLTHKPKTPNLVAKKMSENASLFQLTVPSYGLILNMMARLLD
jgi:hypothetical protein